jgi:hypothetical protein
VRSAGAYEPGWSPEEMRGDMRALEDAAEGLIAALRGDKAALGGRTLIPPPLSPSPCLPEAAMQGMPLPIADARCRCRCR